jgi:hypothetical protein
MVEGTIIEYAMLFVFLFGYTFITELLWTILKIIIKEIL